nr:hypothetical protein CFP56_16899 [Quercus suber]
MNDGGRSVTAPSAGRVRPPRRPPHKEQIPVPIADWPDGRLPVQYIAAGLFWHVAIVVSPIPFPWSSGAIVETVRDVHEKPWQSIGPGAKMLEAIQRLRIPATARPRIATPGRDYARGMCQPVRAAEVVCVVGD